MRLDEVSRPATNGAAASVAPIPGARDGRSGNRRRDDEDGVPPVLGRVLRVLVPGRLRVLVDGPILGGFSRGRVGATVLVRHNPPSLGRTMTASAGVDRRISASSSP